MLLTISQLSTGMTEFFFVFYYKKLAFFLSLLIANGIITELNCQLEVCMSKMACQQNYELV